ncbi:MAG: DNA-binding transcriptional regulator [Planctomycetales bacterium]|nr:DNA-binding transcriptional regulator [Planctomycetales bacterium]
MASVKRVALLLDASRGWDANLLRGIARYANLHAQWQFLRPAATYYQRFSGLPEVSRKSLLKHHPDGIVTHESAITESLIRSGAPTLVVPVSAPAEGGFYITCDNAGVGLAAARHLVGQGHKHFGFVGFANAYWSNARLDAYRQFLEQLGFELQTHLVPLAPKDSQQPRLHARLIRWLRELPKPSGVFVGNDDLARSVAEICLLSDLRIPEEIGLLGVDNDELICELSRPNISSIPFATETAGYDAAELLDTLMQGGSPESPIVEAEVLPVVVRGSTDRLVIEDAEVVRALRFIRDNSFKLIQVRDVVHATSLSQRTLHNRFKAAVGHSIIKEINHQRAQQIARMLTDTSQSINRIALRFGYHDDAHLVRFFRREMGESPGAYRRRLS